jgi:hypothetical protein
MQPLPEALAPLAAYRQFILYKIIPEPGRNRKLPISPHTLQAWPKGSDWQQKPAEWTDAATACGLLPLLGPGHGVGFIFTDADPFFFLDIDDCRGPVGWTPAAETLCAMLPGAAVEVSQSGEGLHVIGTGHVPAHGCDNQPLHAQFYTSRRFVALTGTGAHGSAGQDCSEGLARLVPKHFPPSAHGPLSDWTDEPVPEWCGPEDDDALIKKMLATTTAAGKFGGAGGVAALWDGDVSGHGGDASVADAALAQHLAFWTGGNCERIQRLMLQSGLARDKWDREDYLPRTIAKACAMQTEWYSSRPRPVEPVQATTAALRLAPELVEGYQYLGAPQQIELFEGCVYVQDMHRVFCPNGAMLKPEQFNVAYGGYTYQLTGGDQGKTTKRAWEALTESQVVRWPRADSTCFRPAEPPGKLIYEGGQMLVNCYVPVDTPRKSGDPGRFLAHLAKLLPDPRDRAILLAYMAACIQHKGVKFQWCPLIQGVEGNGKTLFTRCVAFAIGRRYIHMPKARQIDGQFNGWLLNKLFIGVEDIYVPESRQDVLEALKPIITGGDEITGIELEKKGVDQLNAEICANLILNSNHQDGVRKTRNDRRFAPFFTAQQHVEDLRRDGMDGNYFPDLYNWLKGLGPYLDQGRGHGYAIVAEYLATYAIPDELNPAGACHRAPETSSTGAAIRAGMGGIEQDVLEAIDEGRPGFAGGWVSSVAFDRLLQNARAARAIPQNKRRELLQSLGYDWHPGLNSGRVNTAIPLDEGKKPRLFIHAGHIHANLRTSAEIARRYQEAQGAMPGSGSAAAEAFSHV